MAIFSLLFAQEGYGKFSTDAKGTEKVEIRKSNTACLAAAGEMVKPLRQAVSERE